MKINKINKNKNVRMRIVVFIICLQKFFKICIDKMIFWVYNRGGWAGIDNKSK